jgi:hypothetical protein
MKSLLFVLALCFFSPKLLAAAAPGAPIFAKSWIADVSLKNFGDNYGTVADDLSYEEKYCKVDFRYDRTTGHFVRVTWFNRYNKPFTYYDFPSSIASVNYDESSSDEKSGRLVLMKPFSKLSGVIQFDPATKKAHSITWKWVPTRPPVVCVLDP